METRAALLFWPCHKLLPFCPDPFHLWRHTFPSGETAGGGGGGGALGSQHLPCLSTPKHQPCSSFCSKPFSTKARHTHTPAERVRGRRTITIWPCSAEEEKPSSHTRRQGNMLLPFLFSFFLLFLFFPSPFFLFAHPLREHGCHDIISSGHFPWPVLPSLAALSVTWLLRQTARWWVGDCGFCLLPRRRP